MKAIKDLTDLELMIEMVHVANEQKKLMVKTQQLNQEASSRMEGYMKEKSTPPKE